MTTKSIAEQIDVIRNATAKAVVSKESAASFLERAGIINVQTARKNSESATNKSGDETIPSLATGKSHKKSARSGVAKRYAKK